MDKTTIYGVLILACCVAVAFSAPQEADNLDGFQADDYDYGGEEQNASSQQGQTTTTNGLAPHFPKAEETITGIIGKNIILKCDAKNLKDNVILWYKGQQLVSTKNLVSPAYNLVQNDLIVLNATEDSQGEYYCEVQPQKIRKHLHVIVAEYPVEPIVPESSASAATTVAQLSQQQATTTTVMCLTVATLLSSLCVLKR